MKRVEIHSIRHPANMLDVAPLHFRDIIKNTDEKDDECSRAHAFVEREGLVDF